MRDITFKIITDLEEAKTIWDTLSSKELVTDTWEFRFAYYKYFNYPLHFIVAYIDEKPVGLLPLQWNTQHEYLEFFGGSYMEDNTMYTTIQDKELKAALIQQIDKPALLSWVADDISHITGAEIEDYKYTFPLSEVKDVDEFLHTYWSAKPRKNFTAQIRKLKEQGMEIIYDDFSDFDLLAEFNKQRFGDESTFLFPHRMDFFKDIFTLFDVHFITIKLAGEKVSVGMSLLYNGTYIGLNSGTKHGINGLGKFIILQKMAQAISLGAKNYDARGGDLGWKESFHFTRKPQYKLDLTQK